MSSYSCYLAIIAGYQSINRPVEYLYERSRAKIHGQKVESYLGNGESAETTSILCEYLQHLQKYSYIKVVYRASRDQTEVESHRQNVYDHAYIEAQTEEGIIVIDPTYKQFLFWGVGDVAKWTSPYAEYLFNLPPVFIGTYEELSILQKDLRERRAKDPEHKDQEWYYLDDWYNFPPGYQPNKSR